MRLLPNKLVGSLLLLFFAAQIFGILILGQYIDFATTAQTGVTTTNDDVYVIEPPKIGNETYSFISIGLAVLVGTAIVLLLIKYNAMLIWKLWFLASIVISLTYAFYPFVSKLPISFAIALSFTLFLSIVLGYFKVFRPTYFAHTLSELFIYGGLAALFVPVINLTSAIILLVLLAGYDYYMVYTSKHMVTLATASMKSDMIAGLYVGDMEKTKVKLPSHHNVSHSQVSGSSESTALKGPTSSVMIGGGDIAFPLFFAGAVMKYFGTMQSGLLVAICATLGVYVLFSISKPGKFYPAIPFVAAGCFAALGVAFLLA